MKRDISFGVLKTEPVPSLEALGRGQTLGWQIESYKFPDIWAKTKGAGVKVAILDTAIDTTHPDLSIKGGYDFVNNRGISHTPPNVGHGSHVAGIIGAIDNAEGIIGVAPECELYSCVVLSEDGYGSYNYIIKAIDWCIEKKMDIINMSLGGGSDSRAFYEAIRRAYDAGITIVCAAGNSAWETGNLDFPGSYNETLAIASITPNFTRSEFSSIGPNIDVCAPGSDILSCTPDNTYSVYSGTSMATPFITGLIALMIAKHRMYGGKTPINNAEDVREHLIKVAKDVEYDGQDNYTGYGLVCPSKSMDYGDDPSSPDEDNTPEEIVEEPVDTPTNNETKGGLWQMFGALLKWITGLFK